MQVLLPDNVAMAVRERQALQPTHPDHVTVKQLLKSTLLQECHLTGIPGAWYADEGEEQGEETKDKRWSCVLQ